MPRGARGSAAVLHVGVRAFEPDSWPADARAALAENTAARDRETARIVRALRAATGRDADEILLALVGPRSRSSAATWRAGPFRRRRPPGWRGGSRA